MGLGDIVKGGWHPEGKSGGKESWRGDFKGINQVAGWMGKGRDEDKETDSARSHVPRPITSLRDPSSFAPPPKHRDYYGAEGASASASASASPVTPTLNPAEARISTPPVPARESRAGTAERRVGGAPATPGYRDGPEERQRDESPAKPPPGPFKINTTGLSTSNLPPPPVHRERRDVAGPPSPPRPPARTRSTTVRAGGQPVENRRPHVGAAPAISSKPKPSLPPRVPPRNAVADGLRGSEMVVPDKAPPYSPRPQAPLQPQESPVTSTVSGMSELEARLARMRARAEPEEAKSSIPATAAGGGTRWPPVPLGTKPT